MSVSKPTKRLCIKISAAPKRYRGEKYRFSICISNNKNKNAISKNNNEKPVSERASQSNYPLGKHGVCHLLEACDISSHDKIALGSVSARRIGGLFIDIYHDVVKFFVDLLKAP